MICEHCARWADHAQANGKALAHAGCPGRTHCDCQHLGTFYEEDEELADLAASYAAGEPTVTRPPDRVTEQAEQA